SDEQDLGLRVRLLEDVAERDRASLSGGDRLAAVGLLHGGSHGPVRGPGDVIRERIRRPGALAGDLAAPGGGRLDVRGERALRVVRARAWWNPEEDQRSCLRLDRGCRADNRRTIDPKHRRGRSRPQEVGYLAVAEQLDPVENPGVEPELLDGIVR